MTVISRSAVICIVESGKICKRLRKSSWKLTFPQGLISFATSKYIQEVLDQQREVPAPIALQVQHIMHALKSL